jgi:cytochrome c
MQNTPLPISVAARVLVLVGSIAGLGLPVALAAAPEAESVERGRVILEENCARCHSIGEAGVSPLAPAPPFRTLHDRYPLENLEEALAEGIISGHPAMPEFSFEPDQIGDIIAYLKSLDGG